MKILVLAFTLVVACNDSNKKSPTAEETPATEESPATEDATADLEGEINSLKAQLTAATTTPPVDAGDGWFLGGSQIELNTIVYVRVNFEKNYPVRQFVIDLKDCPEQYILHSPVSMSEKGIIVDWVGNLILFSILRIDGEKTAPTNNCKLRARVFKKDATTLRDDDIEESKEKEITIKAGKIAISNAAIVNENGNIRVKATISGFSAGAKLRISLSEEGSNRFSGYINNYQDGQLATAILCVGMLHVDLNENVRCSDDQQLTALGRGGYYLQVYDESTGGGGSHGLAVVGWRPNRD